MLVEIGSHPERKTTGNVSKVGNYSNVIPKQAMLLCAQTPITLAPESSTEVRKPLAVRVLYPDHAWAFTKNM